jgi:hypothetical protein
MSLLDAVAFEGIKKDMTRNKMRHGSPSFSRANPLYFLFKGKKQPVH